MEGEEYFNIKNTNPLIRVNKIREIFPSVTRVFSILLTTADTSASVIYRYHCIDTILNFVRPSPNSVFECHNPQQIKSLTRLRLGLSYLREHKFKYSFQDSLNPLCKCGAEVESTSYFLLHCPAYNNDRSSLLSTIRNSNYKFL